MKPVQDWRLLSPGTRPDGQATEFLERACRRLSAFVSATVEPLLASGLKHEAGTAKDRADQLIKVLERNAVAVLATGPVRTSMAFGEPMMGEVLPFLPAAMEGTIVASTSHAYNLDLLVRRSPRLNVVLGPPIAEIIGGPNEQVANHAAGQIARAVCFGPPDVSLEPVNGYAACALGPVERTTNDDVLAPVRVVPHAIREGSACGPLIVGNLQSLWLTADRNSWSAFEGAVLMWEACELNAFWLDRCLQRLRVLGILEALSAMLVAVPIRFVTGRRMLSWLQVVERAVLQFEYPVAVDCFIGSGFPSPILTPRRNISVEVMHDRVSLQWQPSVILQTEEPDA